MATIQKYGGSSWVDVRYRDWKVTNGTSVVQIAPTADIDLDARVDISTNQQVRIRQGGTTIFEGYARSSGSIQRDGSARVTVDGYGITLMQESVTLGLSSPTDEDVLVAAINQTASGDPFTIDFGPTPSSLGGDYVVENRAIKSVFRDMMDRSDLVWRVDTPSSTIHVETEAGRGTWADIDTSQDRASVREWEAGDVQSVTNSVTVNGTGGEESVTGTAEDQSSIDTYGEQPLTTTAGWVATQSDADSLASNLLVPDPLPESTVVLPEGAADTGTIYDGIANYNLQLTDPSKGIEQTPLVIQKQTIREGRVELECGAGAGIDVAAVNRSRQSAEDAENIDLDEIPNGQEFAKILSDALSDGQVLLEDALGDLDNIPDGGQYARVNEGDVTDGHVILATTVKENGTGSTLDDLPDGDDYARVLTTALDAGQIQLASADVLGDLDDIPDGDTFGRIDNVNLTDLGPGNAVFATGIELDDERRLDEITATDFNKNQATVIDGGEILTGSIQATEIDSDTITADEIDTLNLDTGELTISDFGTDPSLNFDIHTYAAQDALAIAPSGGVTMGVEGDRMLAVDADNFGGGNAIFNPAGATGGVRIEQDPDGVDAALMPSGEGGFSGETLVGTANFYFHEMNAENFFTQSPERVKEVDRDEVRNADWYDNPPEAVRRKQEAHKQERREKANRAESVETHPDDEDSDHEPVELGTVASWLMSVCRDQQKQIDNLESRIEALEN